MMLAHPQMDSVFDFDTGAVCTLVIENPDFFRQFLRDINSQIQGMSGKAVLSFNHEPTHFSGNAEIIDDILSFDLNKKTLQTKILSRLEMLSVNETNYLRTASLVAELEQYIMELSFDLPCGIFCGKMSFGGVLRSAGIVISDDDGSDLERLLDYMELTRELDRDKLFILVNLRSYYSDGEVAPFLATVLSHEYHVLLVDSVSRTRLPGEARVTVDFDLCEF